MKYTVNLFGEITDIVNSESICIHGRKGNKVSDILDSVLKSYPGISEINYSVFLNTHQVTDYSVVMNENDNLSLMPPFAGG